jgi:diaminobutyrate-2-oxoglutarate transaminase
MQQVHQNGQIIENAIKPLEEKYDLQLRGKGMIYGVDVGTGERAKAIVNGCFNDRLLVSACGSGGRVVKLIPPLTIPEQDLKEGLVILIRHISKIMEA